MTTPRILIVEDNEISMVLTHDLLTLRGYELLTARTAEAAIEIAKAEKPNLIVMDIGLPCMDGLTATQLLKAAPETKAIPVVALTAHAMPGDRERALAAGCDEYVAKPFDVQGFLKIVARLIGSAEQPS